MSATFGIPHSIDIVEFSESGVPYVKDEHSHLVTPIFHRGAYSHFIGELEHIYWAFSEDTLVVCMDDDIGESYTISDLKKLADEKRG